MHLRTVTLRNFRCFERLEIPLHPRLTVLVAENGGGKTAVLDGIALGLAQVLRYLSSANQRLSYPRIQDSDFRLRRGEGEDRSVASDYTRVVLDAKYGQTSNMTWDTWRASTPGTQPEDKIGHHYVTHYGDWVLNSVGTSNPRPRPVFAYYGARRGWIAELGQPRLSNVNYDYPTSALVGALNPLSNFKEMLQWFDWEEANELRENKGRLEQDYETRPALSLVRSAISAILGSAYENPHFDTRHRFVIESKNGPGVLQVSQLSQGYQSMLALAMDFARRLALANNDRGGGANKPSALARTPAIMLVDEIDLHLHPSWQQRVLSDLMGAFPETQFIVTTHSPQVLTTVRKECIQKLSYDETGIGSVRQPDHSTLAHESGDALAYVMDVDPKPRQSQGDVLEDVHDYEQMVRAGRAESPDARGLRAKLDEVGYEIPRASLALWEFLAQQNKKNGA